MAPVGLVAVSAFVAAAVVGAPRVMRWTVREPARLRVSAADAARPGAGTTISALAPSRSGARDRRMPARRN